MALSAADRRLVLANAAILGMELSEELAAAAVDACAAFEHAATKLAVYGSLGPGRKNEHVLRRIGGTWRAGFSIAGVREARGWGAALGYPGAAWATGAAEIEVFVFESAALREHWGELDAFEGDEYARLLVALWRDGAPVDVGFAYTIRDSSARTIAALIAAQSAP